MINQREMNPFWNMSYKLDGWRYLLDKEMINEIPPDSKFNAQKTRYVATRKRRPVKFENRLRRYVERLDK